MRFCTPSVAESVRGMGGGYGGSGISMNGFVMPPPAPALSPTTTSSIFESPQQSVQTSPPSFTSSMPGTVNTTVAITAPSDNTIHTTVTLSPATPNATNPTHTASVPDTINPTSNAQPSRTDVSNNGAPVETGLAIAVTGSVIGMTGGALGNLIGDKISEYGFALAESGLSANPGPAQSVGAFGFDGLGTGTFGLNDYGSDSLGGGYSDTGSTCAP
jgi:hypothetical protein